MLCVATLIINSVARISIKCFKNKYKLRRSLPCLFRLHRSQQRAVRLLCRVALLFFWNAFPSLRVDGDPLCLKVKSPRAGLNRPIRTLRSRSAVSTRGLNDVRKREQYSQFIVFVSMYSLTLFYTLRPVAKQYNLRNAIQSQIKYIERAIQKSYLR